MTRKKAIERALELSGQDERQALHWLYDEGRVEGHIAGLREAERWVRAEAIDRSDGTFVMLIQLAKAIGKLAKKARKR